MKTAWQEYRVAHAPNNGSWFYLTTNTKWSSTLQRQWTGPSRSQVWDKVGRKRKKIRFQSRKVRNYTTRPFGTIPSLRRRRKFPLVTETFYWVYVTQLDSAHPIECLKNIGSTTDQRKIFVLWTIQKPCLIKGIFAGAQIFSINEITKSQ